MKLKRMETKASVLLENVRDVFLMFRAQDSTIAQEKRAYDVCALIDEAVGQVESVASAKNVTIVKKMHCHDAPIYVDRHLFLIAFVHILENAIRYTLTPGMVNIAIIKGKKTVRIIVQDRGIGVKKKDKENILLPFARGDKADQYDPDGIGVGLTLARLVMREHKGTMQWKNREGSTGIEVEINMPLWTTTPSH